LRQCYDDEINKKNTFGTKGRLAKTYAKFIRAVWCEAAIVFSPKNLKDIISKINPIFSGFAQHDAQEFFSFLIDGLHEDLNRV
jgi:ubiquitin C-terminal hydrolase